MKKLFLLALVLGFSVVSFAQEKFSEYDMSYFNKKYDIEVGTIKNGNCSFYIYCEPKDNTKKVGFILESKNVESFCNQLNSIKQKYSEWTKTAKDNNVTSYDKKFDVNFKSVSAFFLYGSKWCLSYAISFKPYFKVTSDGECLVVFNVGELTASSNRFMTVKGFMMAFNSLDEIDEFIKAFDLQKMQDNEMKEKEKDNLFK